MSQPSNEQPYNFNFCFPVPSLLESSRVRIVPFMPETHQNAFHALCTSYPEVWAWLPVTPFSSLDDAEAFVEDGMRKDHGRTLFAIYDLTGVASKDQVPSDPAQAPAPALAGVITYIDSSALNLCTEIGYVMIFPPWQRTHVARNAVGLLMKYALDTPSEQGPTPLDGPVTGGLGLRRVVWKANARNIPSVKLAQRMGFQLEGVLRWDRALPPGKEAASKHLGGLLGEGPEVSSNTPAPKRRGDPKPDWVGRDTAVLSVCWDDWEGGVRDLVLGLMEK
ncbi:acyl-CoA N-acyltransferase [Coprinopsis sp. MPI-PUGE-AT-0042]|nr:acyl-CoA N-acyltransferase [Coprinopsis sp. MPI-PUGE-AT-0042]